MGHGGCTIEVLSRRRHARAGAEVLPEAADAARKSNRFTVEVEVQYLYRLGATYLGLRRDHQAQSTFERLLEVAQADIAAHWYIMFVALRCLALSHKARGQIDQARERYEQALKLCLDLVRTEDANTVNAFVELLRFCQKHILQIESIRLKQQYTDVYNHVEDITDGFWNLKL